MQRYAAIFAIVAVAVGVRVAWVAYLRVDPRIHWNDTTFYLASATSLARDFSYRDQFGRLSSQWPPGYSLAVAGVFAMVGTKLVAAKALNIAFSAATVLLTYVTGARVFGTRVGLAAALLLALAPGHVYFSTLIMAETMFVFGFLATITLLIRWTIEVPRPSWWWWLRDAGDPVFVGSTFSRNQEFRMLSLGVVTGCLTLVRSEAVFLAPTFVVLWLVVLPRWRPFLWHSALFGAGFVLALTPWTVRNFARFHDVIPLRTGSQSAIANGLDRNYPHRPYRYLEPAPPLGETAGYMARHPWELIPLEGAKLRALYDDDDDAIDWSAQYGPWALTPTEIERWSQLANGYFFAVGLCALAAAPLLWLRRDNRRSVLGYIVAAWTAIEVISWPETRYHLPLVPIFCMFAAWTIVSLADAIAARVRPRPRAPYA